MVGWAGCFDQWVGHVVELHVRPGEGREAVAAGLLARIEAALKAAGAQEAHVWAPDEDAFTRMLLVRSGYRFRPMRVFCLAVLDLPGLLDALRPVLAGRLEGRPGWVGRIAIETPEQRAVVDLCDAVAVRRAGRPCARLCLSQAALCRMLSGRCSAWALYLDDALPVRPAVTPDLAERLRTLFPAIPAFHPADDLW